MPALDMDRLRAHSRRFVDGFTPGQKAMTVLGVVALAFAFYVFTSWASTPDYEVLFSGLDPAAAGEITSELDAAGIDYELTDGGTAVMVPRQDVYKTRVDLSAKGLPASGSEGWAQFDDSGITKDQFSKRVDYQRALQGELGRTIEAIDGISAASVTLTIPQDSVFVGSDAEPAKASVLVQTAGTRQLGSEAVQSIVHLVSSSVPDLDPAAVTVSDAAGNLLHAPGADAQFASGERLEQRSSFEQGLAADVENLVAQALGPGHAAVTVQADLDFDETQRTTTEFQQPNNIQVPSSESTVTETYTGPGSGSAGVLGPDGTPLAPGTETPVSYDRQEADRQMALNTIEERINEAPGGINRLSVSVLLDAETVDAGQLAQWQNSISVAAGIDNARGDQLQVTRVAFDSEVRDAAAKQLDQASSAQSQTQMLDMVRYVVTLLIVGLVLFLAWRAIKKAEANRIPLRVPLDLRELEAAEVAPSMAEVGRLPEPYRASLEPPASGVEYEVTEMIERQPDEVAQTLRSWLADRRG